MHAGYQSEAYARSLSGFGLPRKLAACDGWILQRSVKESTYADAMGCYPMFSCRNWASLGGDLDALRDQLASVTLVTDPLGDYTPELLSRAFGDIARPFKDHLLIDLSRDWRAAIDRHHVRNILHAQKRVSVERLDDSASGTEDWVRLYDCLIARHEIKGLTAFSRTHFEALMRLPDIRAYRAVSDGRTVGMLLWMLRDDAAYYHLGAYDDMGYAVKASFALFDAALTELAAEGLRWINLGGGAGASGAASGLSRFKEGWSNCRKPAYICGRILNRALYEELTSRYHPQPTTYFPAYRAGEFA